MGHGLWRGQLGAIVVALMVAVIGTAVIAYFVQILIGLRVEPEEEMQGLDLAQHGEEGYIYNTKS